jgi:hypothetical protein
MIIGLNGYSGVGKDEVGRIIQKVFPEDNWKVKKFAGKLKEIGSLLTGVPIQKFEDNEFKTTNLSANWNTIDYVFRYSSKENEALGIPTQISEVQKPMSVREFLQKLGTDALRDGLHPNVWVNALMTDYKLIEYGDDEQGHYPNWVITDVRFINEAIAIHNSGGIIIRIDRPGVSPVNNHPSEVELDHWNFDYKIANVSDLIALETSVLAIFEKANLI